MSRRFTSEVLLVSGKRMFGLYGVSEKKAMLISPYARGGFLLVPIMISNQYALKLTADKGSKGYYCHQQSSAAISLMWAATGLV